MTAVLLALLLTAAGTEPPAAPSDAVVVEELAFATSISSMMPAGRADAFKSGTGPVFFWNRLLAAEPPAKVKHIWRRDGKLVGEFELTLRYRRGRIWSRKRVGPGSWSVDVVGEDGKPIASASFLVRSPDPTPTPRR